MAETWTPAGFVGKVAVITGAAQGIGEATARLLAARGVAGLMLTDRNEALGRAVAASIAATGVAAEFIAAELSDAASVQAIMPAAEARFGRVDILANIAATSDRSGVRNTTPAVWDRLFAVNTRAPFILMQGAIAIMERHNIEGAIVNIASVNAHGGAASLTAYSASKGALVTLTKNVANAVARSRIKVNAINLGWVDTPGEHTIRTTDDGAPANWLITAERKMPWERLIKPAEVARAIAWLASAESGPMTGAIIDYNQEVMGAGTSPPPPRR